MIGTCALVALIVIRSTQFERLRDLSTAYVTPVLPISINWKWPLVSSRGCDNCGGPATARFAAALIVPTLLTILVTTTWYTPASPGCTLVIVNVGSPILNAMFTVLRRQR